MLTCRVELPLGSKIDLFLVAIFLKKNIYYNLKWIYKDVLEKRKKEKNCGIFNGQAMSRV